MLLRPLVAVVSGLDPTGASGLLADIRALTKAGVRIAPMLSAVTVQGSKGVSGIIPIPPETIREQLAVLCSEYIVSALKIGMLGSSFVADTIAGHLADTKKHIPVVLDPVKSATSGGTLSDDNIRDAILDRLLPYVTILTPNIEEFTWLTGKSALCETERDPGVWELLSSGCKAVFIKGGHRDGIPEDHLYTQTDHVVYQGTRLPGFIRGTGCHMASFMAARLADHTSIENAVHAAREYVRSLFKDYFQAGSGIQPAWIPEKEMGK